MPTLEMERFAAGGGLDGARLVLLETPSNPTSSTSATSPRWPGPPGRRARWSPSTTPPRPRSGSGRSPSARDLTVGWDTKALTGHSDLLLGHVSTTDDEVYGRLKGWRDRTGGTPGPFEAWLGHRSMSTLDLRLARQAENAGAVAELLAATPAVTGVRWPWRAGDPSAALAARQMLRPNGVRLRELPDEDAVARLLPPAGCGRRRPASAGCTARSTAARSGAATPSPPGFVRLSCGIEDTADLVADLSVALAALDWRSARRAPAPRAVSQKLSPT